jgi:hypothetical protein
VVTQNQIEAALAVLGAVDPDGMEIAKVEVERGSPKPRVRVVGLLSAGDTHTSEPEDELAVDTPNFWRRFLPVEVKRVRWRPRPDSESGKAVRFEAAQRLAELFPLPVHPARRRRVLAALQEEADAHGRSREAELRDRVVTACFARLPDVTFGGLLAVADQAELAAAAKKLPAALNRAVTEDVLGPGWWRVNDRDEVPDSPAPGRDADEELDTVRETREQLEVLMAFHENEASQLERTFLDEIVQRGLLTEAFGSAATGSSLIAEALAAVGQAESYALWQKIQRKLRRRLDGRSAQRLAA